MRPCPSSKGEMKTNPFDTDAASTEIYTVSLHDALPIWARFASFKLTPQISRPSTDVPLVVLSTDRKSTRLNSSHGYISYAVFCLKKKKKDETARDDRRIHDRGDHRFSETRSHLCPPHRR